MPRLPQENKKTYFPQQNYVSSFQVFWDMAVHDGFVQIDGAQSPFSRLPFNSDSVKPIIKADQNPAGTLSLVLYPKVGMLDGSHASNPWLHELPDPITKVTWDNYARLAPATAKKLGVTDGDVVMISSGGAGSIELPALVQPGVHEDVVAVALGYGRDCSSRFANIGPEWIHGKSCVGENGLVGKNAAPLLRIEDGAIRYEGSKVTVENTGRKQTLAFTQTYHSIDVPKKLLPPGARRRPIVQETTLQAYANDRGAGAPVHHPLPEGSEKLWAEDHKYTGHHWGMAIDLSACTGCSACVISCQAENNIPVVGKDEVRRRRDMHWMRIDRYYAHHGDSVDVIHQPMLCQHCDNAPCETVCPVIATAHSAEGLNEQIYNRCVGTRYCANNCPYKVRRFNWFNYNLGDAQKMALNPDITIRSRGVMEKCTFCVQRIHEAKIEARRKGEKLKEEDLKTACQQSCPANAIHFGDLGDSGSDVSRLIREKRSFRLREEYGTGPGVYYVGRAPLAAGSRQIEQVGGSA